MEFRAWPFVLKFYAERWLGRRSSQRHAHVGVDDVLDMMFSLE
jgi:hypothetical protein